MDVNETELEAPLNFQQQALRDVFVREYMKDFDPHAACIRTGFNATHATHWAPKFMAEGYVLRQIAYLTRQPAENSEAKEAEDRALLESSLREAMVRGPYASRVAAGRAFAELKGWNRPDPSAGAEQALIDALREFAQTAPA